MILLYKTIVTPRLEYCIQVWRPYRKDINMLEYIYVCVCVSAGSIPGFVRYRSIPEFCSILDTYVVIKSNFHIEYSSQ